MEHSFALTDSESGRYSRSMLTPAFGTEQQLKLKRARILVVGAGGLGSSVLLYLTAAGVGRIGIVEFDTVAISNLQRQLLYTSDDLGANKISAAHARLQSLNPHVEFDTYNTRFDEHNATDIARNYDLVVDCSDNYRARLTIDNTTATLGIPMVYATAQEWGGQVSIFNHGEAGRYSDLFGDQMEQKQAVGVIPPVVGVIGSLQATEVMKLITGTGNPLINKLLSYNALTAEFKIFSL